MDQMTMTYEEFRNTFLETLNAYAPIKKKTVRGNNAPFMNKTLSKAFMQRTKLKNKYNKFPTENNYLLYKKQRNFCSNLLKREKKKYYNNLDLNIFKDNKKFWKTVRPFFQKNRRTIKLTLHYLTMVTSYQMKMKLQKSSTIFLLT